MFCSGTLFIIFFFFFNDTATTEIYTLSLHDALPISTCRPRAPRTAHHRAPRGSRRTIATIADRAHRSEEHTSELQSQSNLVCRLLLEKKKKKKRANLCSDHNVGYTTRASASPCVRFS